MHVFKLLENSQGRFGLSPPSNRALDRLCLRSTAA